MPRPQHAMQRQTATQGLDTSRCPHHDVAAAARQVLAITERQLLSRVCIHNRQILSIVRLLACQLLEETSCTREVRETGQELGNT